MQCISSGETKEAYEPPGEWRQQVKERLRQAEDGLEEFPPELPKEGQLEQWKKKYRLYSQL